MFHILNPSSKESKETFGFKTTTSPPFIPELKPFEDELFSLVSNIKFRPHRNKFLDQMKDDKTKILETQEVIVKADKSQNLYKMKAEEYKKKAIENITKDYRKCPKSDIDKTMNEAANLARSYDLEDRIDVPTEDTAFITVKDHKDSFPGRMECRLINPAKNHLGKISKVILEKINKTVRIATDYNQWQNTSSAVEWFNTIHPTPRTTFFKFDIVNFYPSIGKELLMNAIRWAKSYTYQQSRN